MAYYLSALSCRRLSCVCRRLSRTDHPLLSVTELSEALGESFTLPTSNAGVDIDEIRFQKKLRNRANRQRKI